MYVLELNAIGNTDILLPSVENDTFHHIIISFALCPSRHIIVHFNSIISYHSLDSMTIIIIIHRVIYYIIILFIHLIDISYNQTQQPTNQRAKHKVAYR
jgi:hypothetical protein